MALLLDLLDSQRTILDARRLVRLDDAPIRYYIRRRRRRASVRETQGREEGVVAGSHRGVGGTGGIGVLGMGVGGRGRRGC